jgi:hypothetical protein
VRGLAVVLTTVGSQEKSEAMRIARVIVTSASSRRRISASTRKRISVGSVRVKYLTASRSVSATLAARIWFWKRCAYSAIVSPGAIRILYKTPLALSNRAGSPNSRMNAVSTSCHDIVGDSFFSTQQ